MNNFITTLNILNKRGSLEGLIHLFNNNKINKSFFENYFINDPKNFEKKILFKNENYELVLINWENGAFTTFHNHPKNGCILKVLDGKLYEYNEMKPLILNKDNVSVKLYDEYHRIIALEKTYSLHYYSPPNFYI
jgi:quercetin dioxygenase-like cupin family protein